MEFISTRNANDKVTPSLGILKGLSDDGGLYVPASVPKLDKTLKELSEMTYQEVAYEVMKLYFTDFTEAELKHCVNSAYDSKFDTEEIAPLAEVDGAYYLELFHGATIAFKDMALSILPHLMTTSAKKNNVENEIVILTATSGDTGKAALAGFADVPGTKIVVFYPKGGVSPIQERQMQTQKGDNTRVIGIRGNFDQAQTAVKQIFADEALNAKINSEGFQFSSANSINIGRLFPQVAYYVYAYSRLLKEERIEDGQKINICVPTGNFGNILAAYYAKNMGLPVDKLICASNENKVLFDFFETGVYDKNREFMLTSSPSMDILVSSNLERLLYHIAGNDPEATAKRMDALKNEGKYDITDSMKAELKEFFGGYTSQADTTKMIADTYKSTGYVLDTHTAVAGNVYKQYVTKTNDKTPTVIASTASPYKFTRSVMEAIAPEFKDLGDFELCDKLNELSNVAIPKAIEEIRTASIRHDIVCDVDKMPEEVLRFLGV